jgi:hypothetical protein
MQYTELNTEDSKYYDLQARLLYLKTLPMPTSTPVIDDPRHRVVEEVRDEYLRTVDSVFEMHRIYEAKVEKLTKIKESVTAIGKGSKYQEMLEQVVTQFEEDEQIEQLKQDLNDKLGTYQHLRGLLRMEDLGEKYMCFTCLENTVDIFLDPCGHLACSTCQRRFAMTCPFCRVLVTPKRMFTG